MKNSMYGQYKSIYGQYIVGDEILSSGYVNQLNNLIHDNILIQPSSPLGINALTEIIDKATKRDKYYRAVWMIIGKLGFTLVRENIYDCLLTYETLLATKEKYGNDYTKYIQRMFEIHTGFPWSVL